MREPAVHIMASRRNGTHSTAVTPDLARRVSEHRGALRPGFTTRYDCKRLVRYERDPTMNAAISREKPIKAGSRKKKLALIEAINPDWNDLYPDLA